MKASVEVPHSTKTPSLFLSQAEVMQMERTINQQGVEEAAGIPVSTNP
jgi:hypothetical protein